MEQPVGHVDFYPNGGEVVFVFISFQFFSVQCTRLVSIYYCTIQGATWLLSARLARHLFNHSGGAGCQVNLQKKEKTMRIHQRTYSSASPLRTLLVDTQQLALTTGPLLSISTPSGPISFSLSLSEEGKVTKLFFKEWDHLSDGRTSVCQLC